uniref:Si:dkeyp-41f9.3 n=1 Tax=Sinocyclocheilus grahami TaxID=75366 RepID=A0A672L5K8_SINGR
MCPLPLLLKKKTNPSTNDLAASFYGDGLVHLKAVELSSQTSFHVRFRTSRPSGLLFLAAGETNFLWVGLHSGRVQVQIQLGSGERTVRSEKGIPLNDLTWHTVELQHDHDNITLTVDKNSITSVKMPGPDFELDVQDGLFVGGVGDLEKSYLSANEIPFGFRGCLDEILFNEHNLLSSLRPYSGYKMIHEVSLGCSPQFSASVNDSISFFSSKAYMSLPTWDVPQEGVFECEMHTVHSEGILLYSSAGHGNYFALEIQKGHLVAIIKIGVTKTALRSLMVVNDGAWHILRLYLSPLNLHFTLGLEMHNSSFGINASALQFTGPLFLGGVDVSTYTEVQKYGLLSMVGKRIGGGSFKGCLRNIRVNYQRMGLPKALVTKDISVGCEPEKQLGPSTTSPLVITIDSENITDVLSGMDKRLRSLMVVNDGAWHILRVIDPDTNSKHLMFSVLGNLNAGSGFLEIEEQPGRAVTSFSRSDLEMAIRVSDGDKVTFNISITPVNDAPELSLPEGSLFILLEHSRRRMSTDVLRVIDPDTNSKHLMFSVLGNLNAGSGFLEIEEQPGRAVTSFSRSDLEQGKVNYVHKGVKNSRMAIRVSDGDKVSNTVVLRIIAVPLEHKVANNTGVEVTQGEATFISNKHLAVQVNVPKQAVDIRYDITVPPVYGELQRLHSSGQWKQTSTFMQKLLEKERLRYLSTFHGTQQSNITDSFKCTVTVGSVITNELLFLIRVHWIRYRITRNKLEIDGEQKVTLTTETFHVVTKGARILENDLHIRLLTLPRKGHLLLDNKILKKNSTFSQDDITNHKLQYELLERPHDDTRDMFHFQVFSKFAMSGIHEFRITIKADIQNIILRNHGLSLLEGESKVITKAMLFSETPSSRAVHYTVTSSPKHGILKRINLSNSSASNDSIIDFTNQDISEERILYIHDDSETTHDAFTFVASFGSLKNKTRGTEGTFIISIQLVNDQKPIRVVDKVFHVVRDSQRLLTLEDLCYHDADTDFNDKDLLYTRRKIPMGELVLVNDTTHKLYQFHQKDLEEKRVLFIHKGVSYGRFVLFISDGKHYTSTLLEVSAQDPFVKVANNTGLLVQKGQMANLGIANFSISTNMDVRHDEEVVFEVFLPPSHGTLYCNSIKANTFTQLDLKIGHVMYHHDDSEILKDIFNVTNKVKGLRLDASVLVKVYLESHQKPPRVIHNNPIVVEEGKPVKINKEVLQVVHEDNKPFEILYTVKVAPTYGFLRISMLEDHYRGSQENPIQSFSQGDINEGYIQFVQTEHGYVNDSFSLDVTNGVLTIRDLVVVVDIIPLYIPLEVSNMTLIEGSSKALTQDIIKVVKQHFHGLQIFYLVTEGPHYGRIEHSRIPGVPIPSFTRAEQGYIFYVHDGSETVADNFTVVANNTDIRKQSFPFVVYVNITPINDEPPIVTVNRIFKVRIGALLRQTQTTFELASSVNVYCFKCFTTDAIQHRCLEDTKPVAWTATDSFTFTASCPPASLQIHTFNIHISYENTGPEHRSALLTNTGAVVAEGSSVLIDKPNLDASNLFGKLDEAERNFYEVWYEIISPPHHGTIVVGEKNLTHERPKFSQFNLHKHGIIYVHDDSETTHDNFTFDVWLIPKGKHAQRPQNADFIVSEIFNITVTPINDRPPVLKTGSPRLKVVKGDTVTLDPENLYVEDQDTPPEELFYTVISKPKNGFLALEGQLNKSVSTFTQADVNHGRVHFVQKGELSSGVIYFSITDGFHRPLYKLFSVEVENITISVVNNTGLTLLQGQTTVTLTFENLAAVTNERDASIKYLVTSPPRHGSVMVMEEPATHFDQKDLHTGRIFYNMTDLSSPRDCFEFMVFTSESNLTNQVVNITVKPLIHLGEHVRIPDGIPVKLRKDVLDATELASLSASDPIFEILEPPKHGKLVKVTFDLGGASHSVESFSFRDVEQGRVAIEENINFHAIYVVHPLNDSFVFLLKAANVQPARGEFVYLVLPYDPITGKHMLSEPTKLPTLNRTANVHIDPSRPHRTASKLKPRNRGGNHTRSRSTVPHVPRTTMGKLDPSTKNTLVRMESLPRPASDPLLIILPLLACLLLIVILVVLILVFRHRREKRAHPAMIQELTGNPGEDILARGPYLGQPERSLTVPSVIVTPLTPSCPGSPVLQEVHDAALMPAIDQAVSPFLLCTWSPLNPDSAQQCSPTTPSLKQNQHWV